MAKKSREENVILPRAKLEMFFATVLVQQHITTKVLLEIQERFLFVQDAQITLQFQHQQEPEGDFVILVRY